MENQLPLSNKLSESENLSKLARKVNENLITKKFHQPITNTKKNIEGQKSKYVYSRINSELSVYTEFLLHYNTRQKIPWIR